MSENRTLLSQAEIDALVGFLQENRDVSMGSVLDQGSIDKIIDIIRFNNDHGVFFGSETPDLCRISEAQITDPVSGAAVSKASCKLVCEIDDHDFFCIYCLDNSTGTKYKITPECVAQKSYVHGGSEEWGRAITPKLFNKIANLFRIDYTPETFNFVTERFAEVMYGDPHAYLAGTYYPPED